MPDPLLIAKTDALDLALLPALANGHGLITGATGTGKTVTLQKLAESFSRIGVPVFMADIKGDLTGLANPGKMAGKVKKRIEALKLDEPTRAGCPVTLWDVFSALPVAEGGGSGAASHREGIGEAMAKSAARAIGSQVGREILRGVLGSIMGGRRR